MSSEQLFESTFGKGGAKSPYGATTSVATASVATTSVATAIEATASVSITNIE